MVSAPYVVDITYVGETKACNWLQRKKIKGSWRKWFRDRSELEILWFSILALRLLSDFKVKTSLLYHTEQDLKSKKNTITLRKESRRLIWEASPSSPNLSDLKIQIMKRGLSLDNVDNQLMAPPLRCIFHRVILSPRQWICQQPIITENVKVKTNLSLCSDKWLFL